MKHNGQQYSSSSIGAWPHELRVVAHLRASGIQARVFGGLVRVACHLPHGLGPPAHEWSGP